MPNTPPSMQASLHTTPDETEAQLYEAMQAGDLDRLMALWADDEDIACVHPGGPRLLGPQAIRTAFEALFAQGGVDVRAVQVRRITVNGTAVHHVLEEVRVATEQGPRTGYVLATNIYLKTPTGWRLLVHHASPGTPAELQVSGESGATLH